MDRKAIVIDGRSHYFPIGTAITCVDARPDDLYGFKDEKGNYQVLTRNQFKWVEEDSMTSKKSNPKNFRNGDVIRVLSRSVTTSERDGERVFVKFGENYYNLSDGGQMKGYKYLPIGEKTVLTNLSGMGQYFLMDEKELAEAAEGKSVKKKRKEEDEMNESQELFWWTDSGSVSTGTYLANDTINAFQDYKIE